MLDDTLLDAEERMEKAVEFFSKELSAVRTGRANPALVENIKIDYYGTKTSVRELCAISIPEPRLIVIRPFDPGVLEETEKAILKAALDQTGNNVVRAARLLHLGRGSLRYRLEKYGLVQPKRRHNRLRPVAGK